MDKEELFSEFHRILKEQGQEKNCFEVFNEDKTCCIFYIETTEPNQTVKSIVETLNNSVNRAKIDRAIEKIEKEEVEVDYMNEYASAFNSGLTKALEILKRNIGE